MTVSDVNGKKAITNYKTIKVFNIKDVPRISLIAVSYTHLTLPTNREV